MIDFAFFLFGIFKSLSGQLHGTVYKQLFLQSFYLLLYAINPKLNRLLQTFTNVDITSTNLGLVQTCLMQTLCT